MAEIRGEKVRFTRKDMIALHELPSAQVDDPIIVHCPPPQRRRTRRVTRYCASFLLFLTVAFGLVLAAIETGTIDGALEAQAQSALNGAIGPRYQATVGSTAIRIDNTWRIALEARDVDLVEVATGKHLTKLGAMRMAVDPLALLSGKLTVRHMEAENISLDTAVLPAGDPLDPANMRVDDLPPALEQVFQRLDEARGLIERTGTGSMTISGFEVRFPPARDGKISVLKVETLQLTRTPDGLVRVEGALELDGRVAQLDIKATAVNNVTTGLQGRVNGVEVTPFLLQHAPDGSPREGLEGSLDLDISASRQTATTTQAIKAKLLGRPGTFYFDGVGQALSGAEINVAYNFSKQSIEILPSLARLGLTVVPISGAVIDLDRLNADDKRPGIGLDLLVSGARTQSENSGEDTVMFDLKAGGRYLSGERRLEIDQLLVSSPMGQMAGSLNLSLHGKVSPEISFGAQLPEMKVAAVKQLWPFWMARKPRDWVMANMFGGDITNGSIAVFIPAGRMKGPGMPLNLDGDELRISFDIAGNRLVLPGDIPPLKDLGGHFDLKGERLSVKIDKASATFASKRVVNVEGGNFTIAQTYTKPLMADLDIKVTGKADAVAELASARPVNGLRGTGLQIDDFSGKASANVQARFGLISDQNPPKPDFKAQVALDGVDLARPMEGHKIANVDGKLVIDPQAARLDAKGQIDSVPADIMLVEPVGKESEVKRERVITASLTNVQREKLAPGLSDIIDGTVAVELSRIDDKRQAVKLDLDKAALSIPYVGWTKGSGISAKASFEVSKTDSRTDIEKFVLNGDGFSARGDISLVGSQLSAANFSSMNLSPSDNFAVTLKQSKGVYDIGVTGDSADLRPIISRMRSPTGGGVADSSSDGGATVRLRLSRLIGFNDEMIRNASLLLTIRGGDVKRLDLTGVTNNGQAVVGETQSSNGRDIISLTSGDAGSLARFADLYSHMRGGLLNIKFDSKNGSEWYGTIDVRNFSVVNEQRLQSMVTTPSGDGGRSLNSAVKGDIDISSSKFQRGFARLMYRNGAMSLDNGLVRGENIGATFQGMVKDANGTMDMTGTFMPAYGLNRLFGELPLFGAILGNGRDRGLLGITFKLSGKFSKPDLTVNPLSIIAPGVFRQIFEFQ
ncbi:hypothetical protein GAO09_04675 [Rhizobiales bacterium RZME27]|uniref:YhdP central domain-containing protein n=1 Tax=Endobacterium cereale TaxID=2663029 RepID=A0A6A8A3K7_9HYPH|nr:DUF3971 domain-containing protein [Endobacterium cereale]MEB2843400.1 DUF3971 domain-containing protein [Endobacterium cereale]MQY45359.1 hypothetical protein [Endobacterium cereale]